MVYLVERVVGCTWVQAPPPRQNKSQISEGRRFKPGREHVSPLEGAYSSIFKSQIVLDIATQVSVREDMRPFHIDQFKSTTYDKKKPSVVLEDIPGHKEHYHLLVKDDRGYRTRADINSVNI